MKYNTEDVTYHVDGNNGNNDWRFSSPIKEAECSPTGNLIVLTHSDSEYIFRYDPIPRFKIYEQYMKLNNCIDFFIFPTYNDFLLEFSMKDDKNVY